MKTTITKKTLNTLSIYINQASLTSLSLASHSFFATPESLAKARKGAGRQSAKYPPLCGSTSSDTAQ